jgi:DNA-binding NtrC family response regulator
MGKSILIIDDEQDFLDSLKRGLLTAQMQDVLVENDPVRAADFFKGGGSVDIALIDVTMPGMSGVEVLELIKASSPETECIMITAVNDAQTAIECMKKGAYDYLLKPVSRDDLILTINRAFERKHLVEIAELAKQTSVPKLKNQDAFKEFTTQSLVMAKLLREAELHAASDVPVLITGETGTGKELLARAIHRASRRSNALFTPVNMASFTANLFDAEFFGHTKGAFTGAEKERIGYLEHTDKGTIFLDEIGTLSPELQGKLLRVLQEQEFYKIGSSTPCKVNIRIIAATNAQLEHMVADGSFRKDLFYRLKGAWLHMPPLRDRREDIALLVKTFLSGSPEAKQDHAIQEEALSVLQEYSYPGNIRELKSIVQSAVNMAQGKAITVGSLPEVIQRSKPKTKKQSQNSLFPAVPLAAVEKKHILDAYEANGRNKSATADILEIGINTLRRKLKTYGID